MTRRVGLLGGTFDPPHLGHLVAAECARVELGLDEIRLLVAGDPWMKRAVATPAQRLTLVEQAVEGAQGIVADGREIRRSGPTYTVDTLAELHQEEPGTDWVFLLGEDAASSLDRWHRVDELFELARFVVIDRPETPGDERVSTVARRLGIEFARLSIPVIGITSSDLRDRYATGRATRHLVPVAVDDQVMAEGLYGSSNAIKAAGQLGAGKAGVDHG